MPFENLKQYIIHQFREESKTPAISFQNTFSEVLGRQTSHEESLILLLALAPHVIPGFYDDILKELYPEGGEFPEWGGIKEENYRSMQPTGETIQYLLGGDDMQRRLELNDYFQEDHWFFKDQVLYLAPVNEGMPIMSGKVIVPAESIHLLLYGLELKPRFGPDFPAKEIDTQMEWEDLVVNQVIKSQIHQIRLWIEHKDRVREEWGMAKRIPPGYKALFCGPSGTGKTLTASLLGKEFKRPVYRIDLSQIISKYVGETEKNLEKVFIRAENKNWILFFDEADALFGKRSTTRNSQDRFANQSVSYLLQRIEYFNGVVILASNFKNNIDDAFLRRFNAILNFTKPEAEQRFQLWKMAFPKNISVEEDTLLLIAQHYELSGAQINNAVAFCCFQLAENGKSHLFLNDIQTAIKEEFFKEGKMFNAIGS